MTDKLYWKDSYIKEFDARITNINGNEVVLDRTAFFPSGGGQMCDTGTLTINEKEYKIIDVKKKVDDVLHISSSPLDAKPGDSVRGKIDWERRYWHMRYHTAIHLVDAILEKSRDFDHTKGMSTGSQIYQDRARIDLDIEGITREMMETIIETSNSVAQEGHEVVAKEIRQEDALNIDRLARTEPGRALLRTLPIIRVVEIVGVDAQADGGTHVKNTKEIGRIKLSRFDNKGRHSRRVEILIE